MIPIIALASISGVLHILFFFMESVFFEKEKIHYLFGIKPSELVSTKIVFLNQGFYNLFLAIGSFIGIYYYVIFHQSLLLEYVSAYMSGAALVLFVSNRKMYRAALIQGVCPLVTFLLLVF